MRIDALTVVLRPRSSWEAIELGTALVRRHAAAIWRPWFAVTVPVLLVANLVAWVLGVPALAMLLVWWLKPVFDRIPLFVLSRAVFGEVPTTGTTLRSAFAGGFRLHAGYLFWRRLTPLRSLVMPIDVLEGGTPKEIAARRRVVAGPVYGVASLALLVFANFEAALVLGFAALIFLFVPKEYMQVLLQLLWRSVREAPPWLQVLEGVLAWAAMSVAEPFYVGSGFGLYLNRRTEIEGWDIELAFRRMRARLQTLAGAVLVLTTLAIIPHAGFAAAASTSRDDVGVATTATTATANTAATEPTAPTANTTPTPRAGPGLQQCTRPRVETTLRTAFGTRFRDPAPFAKSVDRAFEGPELKPRRKVMKWQPRHPSKPSVQPQPAFLAGLARIFANAFEALMWLLAAGLVLALALTAKRWWPWLRAHVGDAIPATRATQERAVVAVEPLPRDIAAAARRLWAAGQRREALALLYRAAVEALETSRGQELPAGTTEAQALRASAALADAPRGAFARVVRGWQYAAYADRWPEPAAFDTLVTDAASAFGWPA